MVLTVPTNTTRTVNNSEVILYIICEHSYIAVCLCGELSFPGSVHGVKRHLSVENSWDTD